MPPKESRSVQIEISREMYEKCNKIERSMNRVRLSDEAIHDAIPIAAE